MKKSKLKKWKVRLEYHVVIHDSDGIEAASEEEAIGIAESRITGSDMANHSTAYSADAEEIE